MTAPQNASPPPDPLASKGNAVITAVALATLQAAGNPVTGLIAPELLKDILTWVSSVRWYQIHDARSVRLTLNASSMSTAFVDFLCELTQQVTFQLHALGLYEDAFSWILKSYCNHGGENSAIPKEYSSKLPQADTFENLLRDNPWLFVTLLMVQTGVLKQLPRLKDTSDDKSPAPR